MTEVEIPSQWSHSVKLEETAKGVRVSVHVYANNLATAITEAFDLYKNMTNVLDQEKIPRAPLSVEKNDKSD